MREHQTPLLPALDSNIVFEPNGSEGYREKCFHGEKVQSLRVVPQDVLQNWDCLISPQRHTGFSLGQRLWHSSLFCLFHL